MSYKRLYLSFVESLSHQNLYSTCQLLSLNSPEVIQDHESRTFLEDLEVKGYLELEVSGDKESESEDNSDPKGGWQLIDLWKVPIRTIENAARWQHKGSKIQEE
ncbi:hypothetical protein HOY80DRAFT_1003321 [Tuber brumale]|nr:hypothetical protein HOY80DRAFT_1003321 [Tuber brumale]